MDRQDIGLVCRQKTTATCKGKHMGQPWVLSASLLALVVLTVLSAWVACARSHSEAFYYDVLDINVPPSKDNQTTAELQAAVEIVACGSGRTGIQPGPSGMFHRGRDPHTCDLQMSNELVSGGYEYTCNRHNTALQDTKLVQSIEPASDGPYCTVRFRTPVDTIPINELNAYFKRVRAKLPSIISLDNQRKSAITQRIQSQQELANIQQNTTQANVNAQFTEKQLNTLRSNHNSLSSKADARTSQLSALKLQTSDV